MRSAAMLHRAVLPILQCAVGTQLEYKTCADSLTSIS